MKTEAMNEKKTWTTWDELLLACAVKRYGKNWNTIAMELQNRITSETLHLLNAQNCRDKYQELNRRFTEYMNVEDDDDDEDNSVPWVEELRKLRIVELKREVHRYDLSIHLQLKVKRLEEEREQSMREDENGDGKTDLEKDLGEDRSENYKIDATGAPAKDDAGVSDSGNNQFVNESNSTENRDAGLNTEERESEPVESDSVKPDPETKPLREYSWNGSSKPSEDKKADDETGAELHDSAAVGLKGTKESSDVQSSTNLTKKKRSVEKVSGGGGGCRDEPVVSPATTRRDSEKSEPLVRFLDIIRSHKHGSTFKSRLESQKTDKYKSIVRQHVDLETVQTRIEDGSYSSCSTKFYLDLLLLVSNAIVFFPQSSPESVAAFKLRSLVLRELKNKHTGIRQFDPASEPGSVLIQPKLELERSDSLLAKHKSSAPFIVCQKKSSISAKPSTSNKAEKHADDKLVINPKPPHKSSSNSPNEEESTIKLKLKEKPVTGVRSMRRSGNNRTNSVTSAMENPIKNSSSNPGSGSKNKGEAPKEDKKKTEAPSTVKKRGAADFLKRIKKTTPAKGSLLETLKSSTEYGNGGSSRRESRDQIKKRVDDQKEVAARQKGGGGSGKQAKEEDSQLKRGVGRPPKRGREAAPVKRGREGGEDDVAAKKPKRRSRR